MHCKLQAFLFFHHLHKIGFAPFLKEFFRILNKDGILVLFEPSSFFPFSWLTRLGRKIFGNISGLVPDESPLAPTKLSSFIVNAGFTIERFQSVSFSHNIIPLPLQSNVMNVVTMPLQKVYPYCCKDSHSIAKDRLKSYPKDRHEITTTIEQEIMIENIKLNLANEIRITNIGMHNILSLK